MTDDSYHMPICIGIGIGISIGKIFSSVLGIKSIGKSGIGPPLFITKVHLGHFSELVELLLVCRQNNHFNQKASGRSYTLLVNPYY